MSSKSDEDESESYSDEGSSDSDEDSSDSDDGELVKIQGEAGSDAQRGNQLSDDDSLFSGDDEKEFKEYVRCEVQAALKEKNDAFWKVGHRGRNSFEEKFTVLRETRGNAYTMAKKMTSLEKDIITVANEQMSFHKMLGDANIRVDTIFAKVEAGKLVELASSEMDKSDYEAQWHQWLEDPRYMELRQWHPSRHCYPDYGESNWNEQGMSIHRIHILKPRKPTKGNDT